MTCFVLRACSVYKLTVGGSGSDDTVQFTFEVCLCVFAVRFVFCFLFWRTYGVLFWGARFSILDASMNDAVFLPEPFEIGH